MKKLFILALILIAVNYFYGDKIEAWWQGWRSGDRLKEAVADKVADSLVEQVINNAAGDQVDQKEYSEEDIKAVSANLPKDIQLLIDNWLLEQDLNEYGDPQGTMYAGGTPTFDEATGELKNRFELIFGKFPELFDKFKISIEELSRKK